MLGFRRTALGLLLALALSSNGSADAANTKSSKVSKNVAQERFKKTGYDVWGPFKGLISGEHADGLPLLDGKKYWAFFKDMERTKVRNEATAPIAPNQANYLLREVDGPVSTNGSEQTHVIYKNEARGLISRKSTINSNGEKLKGILSLEAESEHGYRQFVDVAKMGSLGLPLSAIKWYYKGLRNSVKLDKNRHLSSVFLADSPRLMDVSYKHDGAKVSVDDAIESEIQALKGNLEGKKTSGVSVLRLPEHKRYVMTNIASLVEDARVADKRGDKVTAQFYRDQANTTTKQFAFEKAKHELLLAYKSGLKVVLFDTQNKLPGYFKFKDMYTREQRRYLARKAHELGMAIWAAGSIVPADMTEIIEDGWDLTCHGGAARNTDGLRGGVIDPAKVDLLAEAMDKGTTSVEGRLRWQEKSLMAAFHDETKPAHERLKAFEQYQALVGAGGAQAAQQ